MPIYFTCDDQLRDYVGTRRRLLTPYNELHKSVCGMDLEYPRILRVIFNDPATIIFWSDDTKTVVKCGEGDEFDPEKGLAMAIAKKAFGNEGNYYEVFKKFL